MTLGSGLGLQNVPLLPVSRAPAPAPAQTRVPGIGSSGNRQAQSDRGVVRKRASQPPVKPEHQQDKSYGGFRPQPTSDPRIQAAPYP